MAKHLFALPPFSFPRFRLSSEIPSRLPLLSSPSNLSYRGKENPSSPRPSQHHLKSSGCRHFLQPIRLSAVQAIPFPSPLFRQSPNPPSGFALPFAREPQPGDLGQWANITLRGPNPTGDRFIQFVMEGQIRQAKAGREGGLSNAELR